MEQARDEIDRIDGKEIDRVALIGGGVIGAGWAARLIHNGIDVALYDPASDAERKLNEVLENARRAYARLTLAPPGRKGEIIFAPSLRAAVEDAQLVQESAPEREDLKTSILREVDQWAPASALICSSTSGLLPTRLQQALVRPERFLVAHPFNPVYLLPLVEICGGEKTSPDNCERASRFFRGIGMHPLVLGKEIDAFIADRLMEALWREALWLVHDGIASTSEIDDAVRYGCGLRWAQMGTFQTFWLAGGEGGMRHMLQQFGPALKWPWTKLMDVPELTESFIETIASQCDSQAGDKSPRDLERIRDDNLIAIMQALKSTGWGAGETLKTYEAKLFARAHSDAADIDIDYTEPVIFYQTRVPPEWTDYNNHMNEARYLECFCNSSDAMLRHIGVDENYVAGGNSYYTVETHICHLREVAALEPIHVKMQFLSADEKRLHVFQTLYHSQTGEELATGEQMFLHVDAKAGRACAAKPQVLAKIEAILAAHGRLPSPKRRGRRVGER